MKVKHKKVLIDLKGEIYLVGGVIRDYLLGVKLRDIDLVVVGPTKQVAQEFAAAVGGSFVSLDKSRGMYRVVTSDLIYDFNSLTATRLEEDLKRRDFTINAVALKLSNADHPEKNWIDPYGGIADIKEGKIKVVSDTSFRADPLRILRMVRFKAQFDFTITKKTKQLATKAASQIDEVANERIKEELVRICSYPQTAENIDLLDQIGIIAKLIPQVDELQKIGECKYHQEDVWTHSLTAVKEVEELLATEFWSAQISPAKIPLLKLAALLHDYGKLFTEENIDGEIHFYGHQQVGVEKLRPLLTKLKFSNQELDYILTLVRYHMRPFALYRAENLTFKGKYRFFKAGADFVADICLLAAADKLSTAKLNNRGQEINKGLQFLKNLIADKEKYKERNQVKLISGQDLITKFNLTEGPKIGEILEKINQLQADGQIKTRREALQWAEKYINEE